MVDNLLLIIALLIKMMDPGLKVLDVMLDVFEGALQGFLQFCVWFISYEPPHGGNVLHFGLYKHFAIVLGQS